MSNAKLMLTDWRGPAAWSAGDRARAGVLVSCGPTWGNAAYDEKPIAGMTTLIGGALCVATFGWDGIGPIEDAVPGVAGDAIYDICREGIAVGYHLFKMIPNGGGAPVERPCRMYAGSDPGNGGNETFAWDLTRGEVCRWLARRYAQYWTWADGLHVDYWYPLAVIAADQGLNAGFQGIASPYTDDRYMQGLNRFIHAYRALRAAVGLTTIAIGQEWQNGSNPTLAMRELNGRYIEQDPDRWVTGNHGAGGYASWATFHQGQFNVWPGYTVPHTGNKGDMVVEMAVRAAGAFLNKPYPNAQYQADVVAFADANACFVSWGRDDQAGISWPG